MLLHNLGRSQHYFVGSCNVFLMAKLTFTEKKLTEKNYRKPILASQPVFLLKSFQFVIQNSKAAFIHFKSINFFQINARFKYSQCSQPSYLTTFVSAMNLSKGVEYVIGLSLKFGIQHLKLVTLRERYLIRCYKIATFKTAL